MPDGVQGRKQRGVSHHGYNVCHARIKVGGAHGMSQGGTLFTHWMMLLCIVVFQPALSIGFIGNTSNVNEFLCHIQIELFARCLIQLDQSQFYFLVSGSLHDWLSVVIVGVALKEHFVDVSSVLLRHIQPLALAGCTEISYGPLIHVTHVIEFVAVVYKGIRPVAGVVVGIAQMRRQDMMLIKITIRCLRGGDDINNLVHLLLQGGILLQCKQTGRTLHHLEQVGGDIIRSLELFGYFLSTQITAYAAQVLNSWLCLLQRKGYKSLLLCLQTRQPEIVCQRNLMERDLCQRFFHF